MSPNNSNNNNNNNNNRIYVTKDQPWEWHTQTPLGFWHPNGSLNLGQTTRPSNNQQKEKRKKKTCKIVDFAVPADHKIKLKESEKKDKYLDFIRKVKILWNMKVKFIPIVICALTYNHQRINKGTRGLGNKRMSRDYPNYCIIVIGQNPGDLGRLTVTQTPLKDHQLTLI